ncbi:restriction endonuclease [Desulfosporosinus shakirovi]|uniref:restriction endonuclease n=1 Tax=Desulfosporosinus shakirovi TaxID=2885154 RepID=UPI001E533C32|nr:restriction endonuclease [Desulfosporosinus sp. SRJS8]MCB8817395.1 restriction endonuclease [Desulfosporosinus sp. SRJS8]
MRKLGINNIDKMTGREFEQRLEVLFGDLGYSVKLTPESGDYGADLVVDNASGKTVVQAKRYSHPVGVSAIQELTSSMAYYSAKNAIVVTNNYCTPQAKELASGIRLSFGNETN